MEPSGDDDDVIDLTEADMSVGMASARVDGDRAVYKDGTKQKLTIHDKLGECK